MWSFIVSIFFLFSAPDSTELSYLYFGNTNLLGVGEIVNGKKEGLWKVYYSNNPLDNPQPNLLRANRKVFEEKFTPERVVFQINFKADLPEGLYQENYPSGEIKSITFYVDGKQNGDFREFYKNGELKAQGAYLEGKREGTWEEFYENGVTKIEVNYKEGLMQGNALGYYPDGKARWEIPYQNGELDGNYRLFFENGNLQERGAYSGGIPNGLLEEFDENGKLTVRGNFLNGKPEGEWISYDKNGELDFKGHFKEGLPSGEWTERVDIVSGFYRKGNYVDGLKEGEWILVDESEETSQIEMFEAGELVSVGPFLVGENELNGGKLRKGTGQRIFYDSEGHIIAKGKYSKGIPKGDWYFYFPKSDRVTAAGRMVGTDRIGLWNFYSYEGEIIDQQDYIPDYSNSSNPAINSRGATTNRNMRSMGYNTNPNGSVDALRSAQESMFRTQNNMNGSFLLRN
ncbi:toxin-antitoxin system YwqK family antitoxin [Algoriphagus kandeliae]|uniref:Toxin-antitoxin system YwqK family antitoxin n=1 Tax=Algoriphagus kandeliae TaxID=2562278 RepID=A0A4Y9QNA1_9BACT|nr:toxin-antitoxin system YwqK family antitoxin [Algoriphagus kandeliae]TFV93338.1 toxin-antitoxin system YwqK family antitoxin [Algoriphagus kandeliae]